MTRRATSFKMEGTHFVIHLMYLQCTNQEGAENALPYQSSLRDMVGLAIFHLNFEALVPRVAILTSIKIAIMQSFAANATMTERKCHYPQNLSFPRTNFCSVFVNLVTSNTHNDLCLA